MRRADPFQDSCLQGGRFIKFLVLKNAECFADNIAFISIAACVNQSLYKLAEGWGKRDGHGGIYE